MLVGLLPPRVGENIGADGLELLHEVVRGDVRSVEGGERLLGGVLLVENHLDCPTRARGVQHRVHDLFLGRLVDGQLPHEILEGPPPLYAFDRLDPIEQGFDLAVVSLHEGDDVEVICLRAHQNLHLASSNFRRSRYPSSGGSIRTVWVTGEPPVTHASCRQRRQGFCMMLRKSLYRPTVPPPTLMYCNFSKSPY
jgi:hypothetical protein